MARYYQAVDMFRKGISIQAIALQLDLSPETVSKYVHAELAPEIKPHLRTHKTLVPYQDYLNRRWEEGCCNTRQLWREITQQGYCHNYATVQRYLARLKDWEQTPQQFRHETMEIQYRRYTPLQMVWLFMQDETDLKAEEQQDLQTLRQQSPELAQVYGLTLAFITMVRDQEPLQLCSRFSEKLCCWFIT